MQDLMTTAPKEDTMTTIALRDLINAERKEHGESKVENSHFLKRVESELEGELTEGSKTFRHPQSGAEMRYYDLTIEQCTLVGMRESKGVRRNILTKLKSMEKAIAAASVPPIERSKAREIIEDGMAIAQLFQVPVHYAQIEVVKEAKRLTNVDYSPLLLKAPAQDNIEEEDAMLEPSQLAGKLGLSTGTKVNTLLADLGLQVKDGGQWEATEKGNGLCCRHSWSKGGKSGYNLKWNLKKVLELVKK